MNSGLSKKRQRRSKLILELPPRLLDPVKRLFIATSLVQRIDYVQIRTFRIGCIPAAFKEMFVSGYSLIGTLQPTIGRCNRGERIANAGAFGKLINDPLKRL